MRHPFFCFIALFALFFLMGEIHLGSLNVNGARDCKKRAQIYETLRCKSIDVLFVQETHSDALNAADWAKEFDGLPILSHFTSLSAGVGVLFSRNFIPYSYTAEEIIKGRLLKIRASFENSTFTFICVYAPTAALERIVFFKYFRYCFK